MATYTGGSSADTLTGGTGSDVLYGGAGNDTVFGGAGDDTIYGGADGVAAPNYVSVNGASQAVSGTGGRANFTASSSSGDGELTSYNFYGVNGVWIGNGDSTEVHTHTMSSQVAGARIPFNAVNTSDVFSITLDGIPVNLATAVANGSVTFDGAGAYELNASGGIVGLSGGNALATGTITINTPFTKIGFSNTGAGNGTIYDLQVNTNPIGGMVAGGDDALYGGDGNDVIYTESGNDTVDGGNGNDTVDGGTGRDSVAGGAGDDQLSGGADSDTLAGGLGQDSLFGGSGADSLSGGDGHDLLDGGSEADVLIGDAGNDSLTGGDGADTLFGGADQDSLFGGSEGDSLGGDAGNDLLDGGTGNDTLDGRTGSDTIIGGEGNDQAFGGSGNDIIGGRTDNGGADTFYGGADEDQVNGGGDNDVVYGDDGNDLVSGGTGADTVYGGSGNDTFLVADDNENDVLYGGESTGDFDNIAFSNSAGASGVTVTYSANEAGSYDFNGTNDAFGSFSAMEGISGTNFADTINASVTTSSNVLFGGGGADRISAGSGADTLDGGDGDDTLSGGGGNDVVSAGAGNDRILVSQGEGIDMITGGENIGDVDTLSFSGTSLGVSVTFSGNEAGSYAAGTGSGSFSQIEAISGTSFGDTLNASASTTGANLSGGGGADSVVGSSGSDALAGDAGNDTMQGGEGGDTLSGGTGDDQLWGGGGNDAIEAADGNDQAFGDGGADSLYGGAGDDYLFGGADNDQLSGGSGADLLIGDDGDDLLDGSDGDDTLHGGSGNDQSYGGSGDDLLYSSQGDDLLDGGEGNDQLFGGEAEDYLAGGEGDDLLHGGAGVDKLEGGKGHDRFQLEIADSGDVILDFDMYAEKEGPTADQLDVSELTDREGNPVKAWDVKVEDSEGGAILHFPSGEYITLQGVLAEDALAPGMLHCMGVPCFAAGTRILTPQGEQLVERIRPGDLIMTSDGQAMPVQWHGQRHLDPSALKARPALRPIRLAAGFHGNDFDLILSPQHGVVVRGPHGRVLVRAVHLAQLGWGAKVAQGIREVTYHHLLLPRHAVIVAQGVEVESLYPGPMALAALHGPERAQLCAVIGAQIGNTSLVALQPDEAILAYGPRCLPLLSRKEVIELRHLMFVQSSTGQNPRVLGALASLF